MLKNKLFNLAVLGAVGVGAIAVQSPLLPQAEASGKVRSESQYKKDANDARLGQQSLVKTDMAGVLATQTWQDVRSQVYLPPGVYRLGKEKYGVSDAYLFVEKFVNNDAMGVAILVPMGLTTDHRGRYRTSYIYQIRPNRAGNALLFSPIVIDTSGNTRALAKDDTNMPYLEVKKVTTDGTGYHFPYVVTPWNGALSERYGSGHLVLRPASGPLEKLPRLEEVPVQGFFHFEGWSEDDHTILVSDGSVELDDGSALMQKYTLVPMNSSDFGGKFFALTQELPNSITGEDRKDTAVKKMAVYMKDCLLGYGHFLILYPLGEDGKYAIHMYSPKGRSLADILWPIKARE